MHSGLLIACISRVDVTVCNDIIILYDDLPLRYHFSLLPPQWAGIIISHIGNFEGSRTKVLNAYVIRDHFEVCF